ncbi:LLM class flavin-dependent oxidoreductase [Nocardia transvalensis]|uniref:LLM class flavin-dependent oxidoreductase n=1 Tax=Nocardia transvalensis TaxID=37333 RepID=UPI0018959DC0|nr:LLM class flavin-dependent oxidoreductase [Nocardia transvalensis]MBF6331195.1 LLM class flavin-dependent oxidoreductase [Nocardia transvalensis]
MTNPTIGVALPTMEDGIALGRNGIRVAAARAEELGLDAVGAADVLLGDGSPSLESIVVLATAAAVTDRIALDFGVLSVPTRSLALLAAQVQTLQYLSGDRVRLGLGIGGFPGTPFWQAVEAPERGRGRLLDTALDLLPALIAGEQTRAPARPGPVGLRLAPAAAVPPLIVGGGDSDAVLRRIATRADGWLPSALTPAQVAAAADRLRDYAAEAGRPAPRIHLGVHCVLGDDPEDHADREAMSATMGEFFQLTPEQVDTVTIVGGPEQAAQRCAAYAEAGVDHIGLGLDGRDHLRQLDLVGEVRELMGR